MEDEVTRFEESILFFADAHKLHGPGSKFWSQPQTRIVQTPHIEVSLDDDSCITTPSLTPSRIPSPPMSAIVSEQQMSFGRRLLNLLNFSVRSGDIRIQEFTHYSETYQDHDGGVAKTSVESLEVWQVEAANIDRAVRILPGVKKMMSSIPAGRYAIATSGAKTYGKYFYFYFYFYRFPSFIFDSKSFLYKKAYGCMNRAGIIPPAVTITADDKRLKKGKPAPDPFLLAADCLGYDPKNCVIFEDSPSGIRAGVASGATVIAVCTSHERSKIENCGAHYVVKNMDHVICQAEGDRLKFTVIPAWTFLDGPFATFYNTSPRCYNISILLINCTCDLKMIYAPGLFWY